MLQKRKTKKTTFFFKVETLTKVKMLSETLSKKFGFFIAQGSIFDLAIENLESKQLEKIISKM